MTVLRNMHTCAPRADGSVSTFSVYINSISISSIDINININMNSSLCINRLRNLCTCTPARNAGRCARLCVVKVLQSGICCLLYTARRYIVRSTVIGHAVRNGKARAAVSTSSQALYTTPYNTVQHRCIEYQCFYAAHCTGAPNIENTTQHAHAARAAGTMARQGRCATDLSL